MCGRFSQTKDQQEIKKRFNLSKVPKEVAPRYNIAPSSPVPVILNESSDELTFARWGLLPSWAKEEKSPYSMINARAETLLERPTFKKLIRSRRCLIIADSFFEWKKDAGRKRPFRILLKDEGLFAFAGIWDCWEKDGKSIKSCAIITTKPNALVEKIHDRMPVILPKEEEQAWLGERGVEKTFGLLKPYPAKEMTAYEISPAVNSPVNDHADILEAVKGT